MALQDQIKSAQAEGYSSQEIIQFLAQSNPQVKEAVSEGYRPDEIISFLNQSSVAPQGVMGAVNAALNTARPLGPTPADLTPITNASEQVGNIVKAGGAGLGNLLAHPMTSAQDILNASANAVTGGNRPVSNPSPVTSAATDIANVEQGQSPATTAGTVGSTIGSFFTPNQIGLQTMGGAAAPVIAKGLGNLATPVVKGLVNAFPKLSDMVGAAPEAISALAENPEAVAGAKALPEVASDVAGTVQGLSTKGMDIAKAGRAALSDETPVVGLRDKLMNYAANLAKGPAADEADQAAADYVLKYAKSLDLNPSESDIGDAISDLDDKINTKYNKANPGPLADAKRGIRRTLSQALQAQNPEYANAMAQSQATFEPTEALSKSFGVEGGSPSDRTIKALRNKNTADALGTQRALTSFPGLSDTINNAVAKDALQKSLLGKLALYLAPNVGGAVQGGVQALPIAGNAAAQTVQGLTQQ
jgi:hypothetical protein